LPKDGDRRFSIASICYGKRHNHSAVWWRCCVIFTPWYTTREAKTWSETTSHSKCKLTDHKLEEKEGSTLTVRRYCVGCYEKSRKQQSREASHATAKKIKTFCSHCDKFVFLIVLTRSITLSHKWFKQ
jgi:hypothetical protein